MRETEPIFCVLIVNVIIGSIVCWPVCPPLNTIFPCECNTSSGHFICGKSISSNLALKYIFQESSRQLHKSVPILKQKTVVYQKFIFENSIVDLIESNSLDGFAFREISIERNDYLKSIDINAFQSTFNITERVHFESNPSIGADDSEVKNLFNVLSQFSNATHIEVIDCGLTYIPDNAFRPLNGVQIGLQRLSLAKNRIISVGSFAFTNLPNIKFLSLQKNSMETFSKLSLVFTESTEHLFLDFSKNQLTSSSFDSEALASIKRPFDLQLSDNFITYLNETVFKHLFKNSIAIKLWRNPINCSDCRMKWTSNQKLCGITNNTISYSQRIEFQCKLFKDNFRFCQNDNHTGAEEFLDGILSCPLISSSIRLISSDSVLILFSILFLFLKYS